jgi:Ser/Thr protein kinase RdoA (MazF antagonist)
VTRCQATAPTGGFRLLSALLGRYGAGDPISCAPVAKGLLNRGYRLSTTRGEYFLKHYLDGDEAVIAHQHRATVRLDELGVPVAPPVADGQGRTVTVLDDGRCFGLYPWVEGRHREGTELTPEQAARLGALLGLVHTSLTKVQETRPPDHRRPGPPPDDTHPAADPDETNALIDELLELVRDRPARDAFDDLAERRLLERRELLGRCAHRRPEAGSEPAAGWVHGDFHPLNVLYRGPDPVAIIDWDRLGVQPRAEEAVRAAAIFFLGPDSGELDLLKVRRYARAYRQAADVPVDELGAAVHRVWWERLNDFWILRWRYQQHDSRADPLFPASAALVVWWTREYDAVLRAFTG